VVPPGGIHSGSRILASYGQTMTMTMTMTNYAGPQVPVNSDRERQRLFKRNTN
jgi:hypothetical protein